MLAGLMLCVVMSSLKVHLFTLKTQACRTRMASFPPSDAMAHVRVFPGPQRAVFFPVRASPAGDRDG
ncbi:MAG: hypothetical protein CFE38_03665 [Comamonadaceae bacterium PBBC1]|nr:MAG: hypothetical protein CFE38_03665 [Comamonadaceae bacterium PBBC1]